MCSRSKKIQNSEKYLIEFKGIALLKIEKKCFCFMMIFKEFQILNFFWNKDVSLIIFLFSPTFTKHSSVSFQNLWNVIILMFMKVIAFESI